MADAMADCSGGIDWPTILKPFLNSNYSSSELTELCVGITKGESELLRPKETNRNLVSSFAVLAADFISKRSKNLTASQLETVNAACGVLLRYFLSALQTVCIDANTNNNLIEKYLNAIQILCVGTGLLSTTEVTVLTNTMKGENLPQHNPTQQGNEKENSNKSETTKTRSDLSNSILEQLTLPLRDGHTVTLNPASTSLPNPTDEGTSNDPSSEISKLFLKSNTESLQTLRAGDTLVDLCLNLPTFKRARAKVEEALAGKPFSLPVNHSEATTLRNGLSSMVSEMNLAMAAINLPVLEPLTPTKLDKLSHLSMAALYCAISQATACAFLSSSTAVSPKATSQAQACIKEEDPDSNAVSLVEQALNMYAYIGVTIKNSTRAGGHIYQNHLLSGAWVLTSGLQAHLNASTGSGAEKVTHVRDREEKSRSPCKSRETNSARSGLMKFQQSFGVLSVALATRTLTLLSDLFEDLHLEACSLSPNTVQTQVDPAPLAAMGQFSAIQRVARILNAAPLNQLLFYLAIVSYRKACTLKRMHPPEGDTFSQSDSTTYYEDMILCSDESTTDDDDDSEPILGHWFEETLAPSENTESKTPSTSDNAETKSAQTDRHHSIVPEKGEANSYISLATNIFAFLNKHFLCSKSPFVIRYVKQGLTEQQMIILAAIIRDLDRETSRTEVGTISVYFGTQLGQLYCEFSGALTRFTHNLITHSNFTSLQTCLLNHLGVSPWNTEAWPLQVYPRTLALLAQVLLLRPQNEKEASVINIWHRFVNTLIENVLNTSPNVSDADNEDLNVEHAQVLLYLFHSLNLMQKKSVVLLLAGGVLRCSEVARGSLRDTQLLHLSRLLLLFDYIMKHLYDAPSSLLEQIEWNLFYSTNLNTDKDKENNMTRMYTSWQDIEDNLRKSTNADDGAMRPRFYVLTSFENNNQDSPKLDGLACNFILGTPDKLRYPLLLDALIEILNVTHVATGQIKMSTLGLCATQYCFTICWRLLQLLPPSTNYMERLSSGENLPPGPLLLHSMIWGPRTSHKNFNRWLKDGLVKQGMYTQHADKLLKAVTDLVNSLKYDAGVAKTCITTLIPDVKKGVLKKESFPPIFNLMLLDLSLAKLQVRVDEPEGNADTPPPNKSASAAEETCCVQDLLPHVIKLTQAVLHYSRWSVLNTVVEQSESTTKCSLQDLECLQDVLAVSSTKNPLVNGLAGELNTLLPQTVSTVLQQWSGLALEDFSASLFQNDIVPSENFLLKIVDIHISSLSKQPFNINLSLKRLLQCCINFICDHAPKVENTDTKSKAVETLIAVTLNAKTEFLYERASKTLDKMIGDTDTDEHQKRVYRHVLTHTYKLIVDYTSAPPGDSSVIDEKILHNCLKFYEKIIEKSSGRQALQSFFKGDQELVKVLLSVSNTKMSQVYSTRVLHFFNKLFQAAEKSSTDPSLNYLCSSMSKLAEVEGDKLQEWLKQVIVGSSMTQAPVVEEKSPPKEETPQSKGTKWASPPRQSLTCSPVSSSDTTKFMVQENSQLLQALTSFLVKKGSNITEDAALTILKALLPLGSHILSPVLEGVGFVDLMVVMIMLADGGSGKGHAHLFPATTEWISLCNNHFKQKEVLDKIGSEVDSSKPNYMLDAACCIMDYVSEVVSKVTQQVNSASRALSPPWESEAVNDLDMELQEEGNEEEDSGDDSDEDALCNKLCTFTITQKEFMNQHWYHCHTCRMLDGVGVCSVCAKVCHKGHDLSYAKYGNFFCDCGAKEDGSCQALVKRTPQALESGQETRHASANDKYSNEMLPSSLRRRTSSPISLDRLSLKRRSHNNIQHLDASKSWIVNYLGNVHAASNLIDFIQTLVPAIDKMCSINSPVGCHSRALEALRRLHNENKEYVNSDQLMVPTLGSQEGAFENVRMNYSGEQGQTIRQLLSAHIVRRVAMCCMTSTHGRRQHLAVSHEKGKITLLQLSALLKQADSSSRKLTLTRLSSAPIPFTVLSLSSNLCNEDYLAVCGLKDCHVLTFSSSGSVSDHLVLHPQLETGNFIIKAIWLPGSQTKLALVTADFVKIYDLAVDSLSPQYYFLVPSGKIRDCTFMYDEGTYHILLMSSLGHIYNEVLNEESSAKHGSFYVTNNLEVYHLDVADANGHIAGGGVSIYYSHTLGLLFYSYVQGKSFISPITPKSNSLSVAYPINISANITATKGNGAKIVVQPLCQWTEIPNHPGLICCAMQVSNNPVILMLKPDTIMIQEIRVVPSKSKIMDMVAIRHNSVCELRTTLILLCEDGSLKMYMANMDQTGFWMSSSIQPTMSGSQVKQRKKKTAKSGKIIGSVTFPVDFFEHCQPMNDVEIGGNDLLQVYNAAQLKHRLNTMNLYVACNKPLGFSVEVTNNDNNMVMTGLRVLVGTQDIQRAPSFVEVFGRIISTQVTRSRWFDIPFSREESLLADKKLMIMFGPSQDPENVTMVDSIKIFGKSKDLFGWPEENEEVAAPGNPNSAQSSSNTITNIDADLMNNSMLPLTKLEMLSVGILEALDGSFSMYVTNDKLAAHKLAALKVATQLLTLPTPPSMQTYSKALLSSLHTTKQQYHNYKDQAILQHVLSSLIAMTDHFSNDPTNIDAESFYRLVLLVKGIAVARPQNLVKFADSHTSIQDVVLDDPLDLKLPPVKDPKKQHLLLLLMDVLWTLHTIKPDNTNLAPVVVPGLKHTEQIVYAIVEIVHAFNSCDTYSNITIAVYLQLLLCKDPIIAFSAKQALSKVLKPKLKKRRVFIPSPPTCLSPLPGKEEMKASQVQMQSSQDEQPSIQYEIDAVEAIQMLQQPQGVGEDHNLNPLEALLGGAAGISPIINIPRDADDEAMVELAIALSLQEHDMVGEQGLQVLSAEQLNQAAQNVQNQEAGHFSDTTASAAGSDDEGSTAATDGSTLRTSPAEQGGSAGSESGGSGVESITGEHNVSGRSSAYGDNIQEMTVVSRSDTSCAPNVLNLTIVEQDNSPVDMDLEIDSENSGRLHILRLQLLERLTEYLPKLKNVEGARAIPFLQVVLQLTLELDGHLERDRACLNSLLSTILNELQLNMPDVSCYIQRDKQKEVQLILMRLLSVLMSRCKTSSSSSSSKQSNPDNTIFISKTTATVLHKADIIAFCSKLLQSLLEYWKNAEKEEAAPSVTGNLLKEHMPHPAPDMTPFFLKQFVKEHASDVFSTYPHLVTEMALRLPYQVHKHSEVAEPIAQAFDNSWYRNLCEYMMTFQAPFVRRQIRKLLLFICGSKEKYRQLRDLHALDTHIQGVKQCCAKGGYQPETEVQHSLSLPYDSLVELMEHLKACLEIAVSRTGNWQKFCLHNEDILAYLLQVSFLLDEGVAPTVLHLLQCAIVMSAGNMKKAEQGKGSSQRKEREKSDDSAAEALFEESNCLALVEQVLKLVSRETFARFIKTFMLETNVTQVRWQAHALVLSVYKNSNKQHQESQLSLLWQLWPLLPSYGRKAVQFVDLLGYFTLKFIQTNPNSSQTEEYIKNVVSVLQAQNKILAHHPNANLYAHMSQFVELEGYYLESNPCLVCNNPEVPFSAIKLSSIKVDSKFTTTTQIVKLTGSHTISKITVRIGELKRTKMVRTVNIYYNNRNVHAVVELKNKPALWHKAKKVTLQSGQTEVKVEFPLPIVACNVMVEYADFYENIQASSETLQCPRCSAAVAANPGVCATCGENVFQCHKCRAINYDEKDPFLCHSCGFCKYAKFDFTLFAKPCCAIEPIENDEDRKKTVSNINTLLEKADRVYKQLIANKPTLENLIMRVSDHRSDRRVDETNTVVSAPSGQAAAAAPVVPSQLKVNRTIQALAQQYCNECKTAFEELSKIIQKVLVSRKEIVAYDRKHRDVDLQKSTPLLKESEEQEESELVPADPCIRTKCYGCCSATIEHCLTLLRALATNPKTRKNLCSKQLIEELVCNNLRRGSAQIQEEVRQLLCVLTTDDEEATKQLCSLIIQKFNLFLGSDVNSLEFSTSIKHEIKLLGAMVQRDDNSWELKLKCMMKLFLDACDNPQDPSIMESIILPCLKILHNLMKPPEANSKKSKDKTNAITTKQKCPTDITIMVDKWLKDDPKHSFAAWKTKLPKETSQPSGLPPNATKEEVRAYYISERYLRKWKMKLKVKKHGSFNLNLNESRWLETIMFNPISRLARHVTCSIIELMCNDHDRRKEILILLTCWLPDLCVAGESAAEFLTLYQGLITQPPWKQYLTLQGVLTVLAQLITLEIKKLHRLEETTLTSDLTQGYALNQLTELMASFLDDPAIRRQNKRKLVGDVLDGYLSLRRLVVQRTRLIDDTQEKLLELLEEMTTGTQKETKAFMAVCIKTVEKCSLQDILTPVFIFERLCSTIYPEENDVSEFFLTLEKDPQQEDFLQGRMLGNPYSSMEPGLGPLMRDVKNKICQDCELVALLEDDNGMELLVNNKIMSLDLAVKDVYKKIWLAEGGDHDAMRVVYRMRGLLGDATEEFIESLDNKTERTVNNEEVYKMANVLAKCDGIKVMVKRLGAIQKIWRARTLVQVLLKLFRLSVKVSKCQEVLIQPELGAMEVFLRTLKLCLECESDPAQGQITEQLLEIMETILSKATGEPLETFVKFSQTFGGPEYIESLISFTGHACVKNNQAVLAHLTRVLAALVYANDEKMEILLNHFKPILNFNKYDYEHTPEDQQKLEMFCTLTNSIERNPTGNTLKDYIVKLGVVECALEYITMHAPCVKPTLLRTDSDELKEFISKPALKYILRFLTGIAHSHENSQLAIASADTIPIIHRLEQVSSDEHVGSLAENLLEALCTNPTVAKRIEEVREFTRSEKKRLAMAMREKQLGQLGMKTNDKGQVTAKSAILQQIEMELGEESGLVCCICREGYKYQPSKVLGIYTFTKRCNVEEYESKGRKTMGYSTVTHFNIVHIDCHMNAVRLARARDEWESAALQNANTKCNGLLPLWGPHVAESAFASCLARHNNYLQESTTHRDIGHVSTIHDLKLLLLRFAQEKSFHEDTGGGGPQSNMYMIPYLIHVALYVINTTRVARREEAALITYLECSNHERWVESSFETDGPLYWATMSILLHSHQQRRNWKLAHLRRLIVLAQARGTAASKTLSDKKEQEYSFYKPYLVFYGLVDGIYKYLFKNVPPTSDENWPNVLADFIRHNDEFLIKESEKLLAVYTEELLPCTSFAEFCDVTGLLDVITTPETYISDLLNGMS